MDKKFTLKELSNLTKSKLFGDDTIEIFGVNSLEEASLKEASFLANPRYFDAMKKSRAGVICITPDIEREDNKNYLVSDDSSKTFQQIAELFLISYQSGFEGIHKTATIHPTAKIGNNVNIGPNAVIDKDVLIEDNTQIFANTYIGVKVIIGSDCTIHSNVSIREGSIINNRVIIQNGAVIGSCGFGYIPNEKGRFIKLKQLGIVILEDDVEIGANTTIDRARFNHTIIKKGAKIDNLVQIAHNVEIGENSALAAQVGISGSTKVGKHVIMGGQVGVAGHLNIEDKVQLGAQSGVSKSLKTGIYRGSPAVEFSAWNKTYVHKKKLSKYVEKIKELEEKLSSLLSFYKN